MSMDYQIGMYCIEQKMTEVEVHGNIKYALELKAEQRQPYFEEYQKMEPLMKEHKDREIQELAEWTVAAKKAQETKLAAEKAAAREAKAKRRQA